MAKQASNGKSKTTTSSAKKTAKKDSASDLRELFEDQLKDIYWAEKALTKAIPKMIQNASSQELIDALTEHLEVTKQQVTRCEEIFEAIGEEPEAKKCEAMEGLIKEGAEIMESTESGSVRDAGIIGAAQKVEHYEIASYGTLVSWAKQLGETEAASLLEETLNEEKEADVALTEVAEGSINEEAEEMQSDKENGSHTMVKSKKRK